MDCTRKHCQHN